MFFPIVNPIVGLNMQKTGLALNFPDWLCPINKTQYSNIRIYCTVIWNRYSFHIWHPNNGKMKLKM